MRRIRGRSRVFAIIWAVLQFALPASAMLADARFAVASPHKPHVEEAPGRDCVPTHSPDCGVCKHLSSSALGTSAEATDVIADRLRHVPGSCVAVPCRPSAGVPLPRAPPPAS